MIRFRLGITVPIVRLDPDLVQGIHGPACQLQGLLVGVRDIYR